MHQKTKGIVLRTVKYGESSVIATVFTEVYGVEAYLVRGIRSVRQKQNKAAFFQPGMLLEMVVYHQPMKNIQHIDEYQAAYVYKNTHQDIFRNAALLFCIELLLRLLPEQAQASDLFQFAYRFFVSLDTVSQVEAADYPLVFVINCASLAGFEVQGSFSAQTPYLHVLEGGFSGNLPPTTPSVTKDDAQALYSLLCQKNEWQTASALNADRRFRLIEWYLSFLQAHSQHMGQIKSLAILRTILH